MKEKENVVAFKTTQIKKARSTACIARTQEYSPPKKKKIPLVYIIYYLLSSFLCYTKFHSFPFNFNPLLDRSRFVRSPFFPHHHHHHGSSQRSRPSPFFPFNQQSQRFFLLTFIFLFSSFRNWTYMCRSISYGKNGVTLICCCCCCGCRWWCEIQCEFNWEEDRVPRKLYWKGLCVYNTYAYLVREKL